MKKLLFFLLPFACLLAGCKYDDSDVWDELNSQSGRISVLENLSKEISSLQSTVNALQQKLTVTSVRPTDNGYDIFFSDGTSVNVASGASVGTPAIGAKDDGTGVYYWTLNGDWLLDQSGKKVSTGTTPKLKIDKDRWFVSYDNGSSWTEVEGQLSPVSIFKSVTTDASKAYFNLNDGSVITIPLASAVRKLQIIFDESKFEKIRPGEVLSTTYTIEAADDATVDLQTFESDGWKVTIYPADDRSGRISIKAPDKVTSTKVLFLLTDDKDGSFTKIITIGYNETQKPVIQTHYTVDPDGGELTIPLTSCTAVLDEEKDWLEITSVGEEVTLNITSNESYDWRFASITLEDGTVITLTQITRDALVLSEDLVEIDGRRQQVPFAVNTNIVVSATVTEGAEWLSVTPKSRALEEKIFTFTAMRNTTGAPRTAKVVFSGNELSGTCTVVQSVYDGPETISVSEAVATEEGCEIELEDSFVTGLTSDGYVVTDGESYIHVNDPENKPAIGDSVSFKSLTTILNGLPALECVENYVKVASDGKVVYSGATDITSQIDTYSQASAALVKVKGDLSVGEDGSCLLTVEGASSQVIIYSPYQSLGIEDHAASKDNVTLTGYWYGNTDGLIYIIVTNVVTNHSGGGGSSSTVTVYNYRKVTSVVSGKSYLIVAEEGSTGHAASQITSNYGYLQKVDGTLSNGVLTLEAPGDEFVFTSSGSGYTIRQADGRYLYQVGTYNSFNVDQAPSSGESWSVTSDNNGSFTITNLSVNKFIQYSTGYKSFGSYASAQSGGLLPCLYEYSGTSTIDTGGQGGGGSASSGETETLDFSSKGFENGVQYTKVEGNLFTVTFGDGANDGKYYNTGNGMRIYGNGYVQISSSNKISKIVYTFQNSSSNYPNAEDSSVNTGSFSAGGQTATWTGSAQSVKLTRATGTGHWRLQKVEVTFE